MKACFLPTLLTGMRHYTPHACSLLFHRTEFGARFLHFVLFPWKWICSNKRRRQEKARASCQSLELLGLTAPSFKLKPHLFLRLIQWKSQAQEHTGDIEHRVPPVSAIEWIAHYGQPLVLFISNLVIASRTINHRIIRANERQQFCWWLLFEF